MTKTVWRLKKGEDRRFRSGHPWVYSNELQASPKGIEPGAPIELQDAGGKFLAHGYGNPKSLIAFRSLSRIQDIDPFSRESLLSAVIAAGQLRSRLGLSNLSHRLVFGEADDLPGLIIDRFKLENGQVYVLQAGTAGMDRLLPTWIEVLEQYNAQAEAKVGWDQTAIVLRNDVGIRALEGLKEEEPKILKTFSGLNLSDSAILVKSGIGSGPLLLHADLAKGQKTGMFLDQSSNIELAISRFRNLRSGSSLRILDLCCYVGQWGAQLTHAFAEAGIRVEVLAVDSSQSALEFARRNILAQGGKCETIKGDVLKDLQDLKSESFDIVVADPPAFIKGRKDIPTGTHAYLQLNTQAIRLAKKGGGIVSCSCSGLLEEEKLIETLAKASNRNQRSVHFIGRGGQAPDHPILAAFPEGRYLKCWLGIA